MIFNARYLTDNLTHLKKKKYVLLPVFKILNGNLMLF